MVLKNSVFFLYCHLIYRRDASGHVSSSNEFSKMFIFVMSEFLAIYGKCMLLVCTGCIQKWQVIVFLVFFFEKYVFCYVR